MYLFDFIMTPLQYPFMVRGLIASVIVGIVCAVLGVYVVLRGMALLGNALAHAILPGVAISYLWAGYQQTWLFVGGLLAGIITALGIGSIRKGGVKEDTAVGVIFSAMFILILSFLML